MAVPTEAVGKVNGLYRGNKGVNEVAKERKQWSLVVAGLLSSKFSARVLSPPT